MGVELDDDLCSTGEVVGVCVGAVEVAAVGVCVRAGEVAAVGAGVAAAEVGASDGDETEAGAGCVSAAERNIDCVSESLSRL